MYVNVAKLRGIMLEKGYTQGSLSQAMGIDRSTLSRKFRNSGMDFTSSISTRTAQSLHKPFSFNLRNKPPLPQRIHFATFNISLSVIPVLQIR